MSENLRPILLAFALAALGWIGWSMFHRYSPEGQAKHSEWAQVELCRDEITKGNAGELPQRVARCDRLAAAYKAKWK